MKATKQTELSKEQLVAALKTKAQFWTAQMICSEYFGGSIVARAWRESVVPVYENSALHLRSPRGTLATLKKNLLAEGLAGSSPGNPWAAEVARRDILRFLETGHWLIPAEPRELPAAVENCKREKRKENLADIEEESRRRAAKDADAEANDLERRLEEAGLPELKALVPRMKAKKTKLEKEDAG